MEGRGKWQGIGRRGRAWGKCVEAQRMERAPVAERHAARENMVRAS